MPGRRFTGRDSDSRMIFESAEVARQQGVHNSFSRCFPACIRGLSSERTVMSTTPASHDCPNLSPDDGQMKPPRNPRGQHDRIGFPSPGPRAEVLVDKNSGAASRAVPSIEIDESTVSEEFELSINDKETEYCDILWTFFYCVDRTTTQAKIINKKFAFVLAQELSPYYKTEARALARNFQSWVDLGTLHRMFYLFVTNSKIDRDGKIYQVVKKCEEETVAHGKMVLEDYKLRMNGDGAGDKAIARLRTNLFLDLSLGNELDLFVDEQGKIDGHRRSSRYRLDGWTRIGDQSAELRLRSAVQESPNPDRSLTVDITEDIISKLRSQGIFFHSSSNPKQKRKRSTLRKQGESSQRKVTSKTKQRSSETMAGSKAVEGQDKDECASGGDTDSDMDNAAVEISS
jgi:hypothetical protein